MICILSIDFNFHFIRVKRGDRIAQLICEKIEMAHLVEEQVCVLMFFFLYLLVYILQKLEETVRGSNGFGSSGGFSNDINGNSH